MVDLDEEFARFAAELKSVEEATKTATADEAAPSAPSPLAPPPLAPPPATQAAPPAAQPAAAAAAPPPLVPPPVLPPAPILPPPPAAVPAPAAMVGYGGPAGYGGPGMGYADLQQQQYMGQQMPGYQQPFSQPDSTQLGYPPAQAAAGSSWPNGSSSRSARVNPNAPADPETLKRLKEELLQQKAADKQAGAGAGEKAKPKVAFREAAGQRWVDPTLQEWPDNDFRIFVGDIGNEVNDDVLSKAFQRYPSFAKAKVIRDKRTNKSKGYGIVSLLDGNDFAKALREMNGKYIGNRPCKLSKSTWNERSSKGGFGGGGGNKRKGAPAGAAADGAADGGGGGNKVQKTGPKFKYHVPILRK